MYGTPSYWMQQYFRESSGAIFNPTSIQSDSSSLAASAITWKSSDNSSYLKIKVKLLITLFDNNISEGKSNFDEILGFNAFFWMEVYLFL